MVGVQKDTLFGSRRLGKCRKELKKLFLWVLLPITISFLLGFWFSKSDYIVNISNSIPVGIYKRYKINRPIKNGDIILFLINKDVKRICSDRHYINPKYVKYFMKRVVGVEGDSFSYEKGLPTMDILMKNNKENLGVVLEKDPSGRIMPKQGELTLKKNEYFVLGDHELSLDSRYFGKILQKQIVSFIKPVFTLSLK